MITKNYLLAICLLAGAFATRGQEKIEGITIKWPISYNWKIVGQEDKNNVQRAYYIPGNETIPTASLLGVVTAYSGLKYPSIDALVKNYRKRTDTGTVLTVLEEHTIGVVFLVLFKVETPVTKKYPVPESDLYYVIQGNSGVYENYISIKEPSLSQAFIDKWTEVLKSAELTYE